MTVTQLPSTEIVAGAYGIGKLVGEQAIVQDVSLEIARDEILLLTGKSGSGKSTVMRMMAGVDSPSRGHVELLGKDLTSMDQRDKSRLLAGHVAVGFQSANLDTNFNGWDNLIGLTEANGHPVDYDRAAWIVSRLGLKTMLDKKASKLSGGEKLRLSLGRATMSESDVMFFDEPTSGLDDRGKEEAFQYIEDLCRASGSSALIVTHDVEPAREIADREVVMSGGRLINEVVYDRPHPASVFPPSVRLGA